MNFSKEAKNGEAVVNIQGKLSVNEAAELRKNILEWFHTITSLTLDLGDVSDCDTSIIQLLYSAKKSAENMNKTFSVIRAAECITTVSDQIGFDFEKVK